jgi:hypothetical protein
MIFHLLATHKETPRRTRTTPRAAREGSSTRSPSRWEVSAVKTKVKELQRGTAKLMSRRYVCVSEV